MNSAQILGYPLLPLSALEVFLGLLLLRQNPRNSPVNKVTELTWQAIAAELRHPGSAIIDAHGVRPSIDTRIHERNDNPGSTISMNLFRIYKE